jgi:hypothetical protein
MALQMGLCNGRVFTLGMTTPYLCVFGAGFISACRLRALNELGK